MHNTLRTTVRTNMKRVFSHVLKSNFSTIKTVQPKICVVGGGPAGFYAVQHLVKHVENAQIDIIERLPVPFGLVRFGVAPDHPEVKNVINTFTKTAQHKNVRFIGNVNLGTNISLKELKSAYHIVLLTYGAERDRKLNVPGEDLGNVLSARTLVGWYNGIPWDSTLKVDLSSNSVAIFGQGNVAIDVARILLSPVDLLKKTDITEHALQALSESKVKTVYLIGRRGPLQAAFTIKELREMLKLPNCATRWNPTDFSGIEAIVPTLARPRKRLTELMLKSVTEFDVGKEKQFVPVFYRSPIEITGENDRVRSATLACNKLRGETAVATDKTEELPCDLAVRSIGYKSQQADYDIPFDDSRGIVRNDGGRVCENVYVAGWLGTGPTGVILSTMSNAFEIGNSICRDLKEKNMAKGNKAGFEAVREVLGKQNVATVSWEGWEKIDEYEREQGKKTGKPREKILDINRMLEIAA